MTISLNIDTLPQESRHVSIAAWHETFGDLTTPVYFNVPGAAFTLPSNDAKRFGLWLLGIKDPAADPDAYLAELTATLQAADIDGEPDTPEYLARYLLDRGWVKL
jgi:hypothetical protein